ncbi:hypothetical protein ABE073_04250 [Lederbergia citrisecunda]|uniref:hypothetical protein n=1 Tax=Lederbergia citrisecunda TaxID=2833583 RepID=UPI003D2A3AEE
MKVTYIILNMEEKKESPVVSVYDNLDDAIEDAVEYGEMLDVEDSNNIWIEHWEDGVSVRMLKINEETGEYESRFDDTYIPELEDVLDD